MSVSTPLEDDSASSIDRFGYNSLIQPQYTYHRFLESWRAYCAAAYGSVLLPGSGIGYGNETSTFVEKAEDHPSSNVGDQATNTRDAQHNSADMFKNAKGVTITDSAINNTSIINNLFISPKVILIISLVFICVFSLIAGTNEVDTMHGLKPLDGFISREGINGSWRHDPKRQVHEGTRKRVLSQIRAWIDNPDATERILWLHGPAGVGKSAIVQTIMNSYTAEKIPASFVFFRLVPDLSNGNRLFTTLAWQFTSSIPTIKRHIIRTLRKDPNVGGKNVETQFRELIVHPFEALSKYYPRLLQLSDKIVVIEGVDECADERLQEQILKVIGNVATNIRVPLRFFISSRSEAHINNTINSFRRHTLSIDLAECPDADHDIEKYFKDQLDNIAKGQGLDPKIWPAREKIQQLVAKASGQFLYASTVINFVSDEDNSAKSQLDIILGLKPPRTQPFAELDRLYIEILERQPNQEFLRTFLPSLVAQNSISVYRPVSHRDGCLYPDLRDGYEFLVHRNEQVVGLRSKLRKMGSLLKSNPEFIGVHHLSFLDFLQDPSRSGQYNISTESAARQHIMLVIGSLVQSASESLAIEQPDYRPPVPELVGIFARYPSSFDNMLSREDWGEALRPLLNVQNRLLNLTDFTIPRNECTIFHVVHRVQLSISYRQLVLEKHEENHDAVMSSILTPNLPGGLSSLPAYFRRLKGMFGLMHTLLHVKPEVIALSVRSWSEAQNLMDLICYIVNGNYVLISLFSADAAQKATKLALEIHTRVPVLPQCFLSTTYGAGPFFEFRNCWSCDLEALGRVWLFSNILDHEYIFPVLGTPTKVTSDDLLPAITLTSGDIGMSLSCWQEKNPSSDAIIIVMFKLARAIQYLHSFGVVLFQRIGLDDIYVDSRSRVRISPMQLVWSIHGQSLQLEGQRYESNIYKFGYFFCTMYFDPEFPCTTATGVSLTELESSVRGDVWQLVQRCLSAEGKPSMNDVVEEMESWEVGS